MQDAGMRVKALEDRPLMSGVEEEFIYAYNVMAARRTMGLAPHPIQLSEIVAFVQVYGPPTVPLDLFVTLIGRMDSAYLELAVQKREQQNGNQSPS